MGLLCLEMEKLTGKPKPSNPFKAAAKMEENIFFIRVGQDKGTALNKSKKNEMRHWENL